MDFVSENEQENSTKVNSRNFISHTIKLLAKRYKRDLENEDLYELPTNLKSKHLGEQLEKIYIETKETKPSIIKSLIKRYLFGYILLGLSQLVVKLTIMLFYWNMYWPPLFVSFIVETFYDQWYISKITVLKIRVRAALSFLIYKKCLKLTEKVSIGNIITLVTKDIHSLEIFIKTANDVWICTIQSLVLFYLLYRKIGFIVLAPVTFFLILLPLQIRWSLKSTNLKTQMLETTDNRFQATQEMLSKIRNIKMYQWEDFFMKKLSFLRLQEIQLTHTIFLLKFIIYTNATLWISTTFFPWMAIFINFENKINPKIGIFMFKVYQTLGHMFGFITPLSIFQIAQALAAARRIDNFLQVKEVFLKQEKAGRPKVVFENVRVTIIKETILRDLNFNLERGLVQISGAVGSGKTVLLKTILGEYLPTQGRVITKGSFSYASQEPWIFPSTIKQNILFGEKFDEKRYNQVLDLCGLKYDIQKFHSGDLTFVGNNSLSGGQKARINLARALYKDCDIYLLDGTLASVDYLERFLQNKLVLLVTNNLDNCQNVTTKEEILQNVETANEESELLPKIQVKNIHEERKKVGGVELKVYQCLVKTAGPVLFLFMILLAFCLPVVIKMFDRYITSWASNEESIANCTNEAYRFLHKRRNIITEYIALIMILLITIVTSTMTFLTFARNASVRFHKDFLHSVMTTHFDKYSTGTIFNRLSRDFLDLDEVIPFLFLKFFKNFFILILLMSVHREFITITTTFLVVVIVLRKIFLSVATSLKRMEALAKSRIVDYFNNTVNGLVTIRAKNTNSSFEKEFGECLDLYSSVTFSYLCSLRCFCVSFGLASSTFLGFIVATSVDNIFLIQILRDFIFTWCKIEIHMTSLERILECIDEKKESLKLKAKIGKIRFKNFYLSYTNLEFPIFKNLNLVIPPKGKIGIIGRSGSGKTSLINSLLNLTPFQGKIYVDDIDIKNLSRFQITVVPQNPTIFQTTIRENIDALRRHTDSEIWKVLEIVKMEKIWDLNAEISNHISAGEKQLICLAKAILEKNKIVLIDDFYSDFLLMDIIKECFFDCTVLTVSHNFWILSKCDKVIGLENGEVVEIDKSLLLCEKELQLFRNNV